MSRAAVGRIVTSLCVLFVLASLNLWGWRPFFDPDAVENGEDEIQLAPQRVSSGVQAVQNPTTPTRATFGGNPYLVGPIVNPTTTVPEAETNIAINPVNSSNFVALITDYSMRPGGDLTNGLSKYVISNDGGQTWTEQFVPSTSSYPATSDGVSWLLDRDPGIAIDLQGHVYFSGLYLKLAPGGQQSSKASANLISRQTYPGGVYVCSGMLPSITLTTSNCNPVFTYTKATGNTTSVDRDWIAVDASTSQFSGNVYAVWTHYTGCTLITCTAKFIAFSRSTDHGVTWSPLLQVSAPQHTIVDWSMVTVGNDGTIYVAYQYYFMTNNMRQHFLTTSTDGGVTFSTPVAMTPQFRNVVYSTTYRENSAPNVVVSPVVGGEYVYDAWAEQVSKGTDIAVAKSIKTKGLGGFTTPVVINDSTAGQRQYVAAAVDGNGTVHTIWLDTRNSSTVESYDVYGTFSKNKGASWAPNARVTPALMNGNTSFLGDFFGITVEPSTGVAHAVWSNAGLASGFLQTTTLTPQ
ncbi:MAG: hypothetical protein ACRESF_18745 [Pseudomonas sp.]